MPLLPIWSKAHRCCFHDRQNSWHPAEISEDIDDELTSLEINKLTFRLTVKELDIAMVMKRFPFSEFDKL